MRNDAASAKRSLSSFTVLGELGLGAIPHDGPIAAISPNAIGRS
jgi:hypothetical protein